MQLLTGLRRATVTGSGEKETDENKRNSWYSVVLQGKRGKLRKEKIKKGKNGIKKQEKEGEKNGFGYLQNPTSNCCKGRFLSVSSLILEEHMWYRPSSPTSSFKRASRNFQWDVKVFPLEIAARMVFSVT